MLRTPTPFCHDLYFEPKYEEFRARTIWSISNAFTSAFKELDPIPQFKVTAKLGEFLETQFSGSFQTTGGVGQPAQPAMPVLSKRSESVEFTRDSLKEGRSH